MPTSLPTAVMIAGVLGQVDRRPRRPAAVGRIAKVGDEVHRVGRRAAVAERQQLAAGSKRARRSAAAAISASRLSPRVCSRSAPTSSAFISDRARATSSITASRSRLALGEERIEEARGAAVVDRAGLAPREQAAVLEEDVDQLPEHVVGGLDQLLARRTGPRPRAAAPTRRRRRPRRRSSGSRARAPPRAPRGPPRRPARGPEGDHDVVGLGDQVDLRARAARPRGSARSPAAPACRRSPGGRTRP